MRLHPSEILSRLNASYWFVPLLVTLAGVALAIGLMLLDATVSLDPSSPLALLRPSSADGARALLSAVIGAMITAISVTFSVTIVALTVAAQHFGPRVLNSFVRQTSAQVVLGTFLATFVYAVLALGGIRGTGPDAEVPQLTVSGAVVLVIVSIGALIYYVHHVSTTLQIGELAAAIAADFRGAVACVDLRGRGANGDESPEIPEAPGDAGAVPAVESGYVQRIDYKALAQLARERDATIWVQRAPGAFVIPGTPLAVVAPPRRDDDILNSRVRHAFVIGTDRTLWHDPDFAVQQLVEIALRALSPGVNEPFTATTCIDRLAEGLACAAAAPPAQSAWCDDTGRQRVFVQPQRFATLLQAAFNPIRIYAGQNPAVYGRLLESLAALAPLVHQGDRHLVRDQADLILRVAERELAEPEDRRQVELRHRAVQQQLARRPASEKS